MRTRASDAVDRGGLFELHASRRAASNAIK